VRARIRLVADGADPAADERLDVVDILVVAHDAVDRRQERRLLRAQVALGGRPRFTRGEYVRIVRERDSDPLVFIDGRGIYDRQRGRDLIDLLVRLSGQRVQRFELNALVAFRLNALHDDVVVRGRRVEDVGDRDETHVETLLHLLLL